MTQNKQYEIPVHTAVLGAGVIGASWAALFLAAGRSVAVYDVTDNFEQTVRNYVANVWPTLEALALTTHGNPDNITFHDKASSAVDGAGFIQESVPERLEIKQALYREIEESLSSDAIIASSASGLTLSEMQGGWHKPARFILGHPFNPPHLIPLVELLANSKTDDDVLPKAEAFYHHIGKVTIRVKREVPAHVANRLQAALWREAISLVADGVASVEDVDKAIWAGPGLRWAAMGPHQLFHLGAGVGGMEEFCNRYAPSFHRWWDDLGTPELTPETVRLLVDGLSNKSGTSTASDSGGKQNPQQHNEDAAYRDELIVAMLNATRALRK